MSLLSLLNAMQMDPKAFRDFGNNLYNIFLAQPLFSIDLIVDLQALLNFTYEFIELPDENVEFGIDVHSNGSFNGMIGMLQRNEADVLLADIPITSGTYRRLNRFESKVPRKVCRLNLPCSIGKSFPRLFKRLIYRTSKAYRLFGCIFGNGLQVSVWPSLN